MIDFIEATEVRQLPPLVRDLIDVGYPRRQVLRWHRAKLGHLLRVSRPKGVSQSSLLRALESGPATTRELAERLRMSPENVTMRLKSPLRSGLVRRERVTRGAYRYALEGLR